MSAFSAAFMAFFATLTSFFNGLNGLAKGFESIGNVVAANAGEYEDEAAYNRAVAAERRAIERAKMPKLAAPQAQLGNTTLAP
jgi:hypothetical protein